MNTISDIPVLFFPFSRPLYARQTFDAIKKVKPKKFYFYCDKASEGKDEEIKNNNIIRNYIKEIDWECDLKTWFRDENIGVYQSILDAIDWFFEHEEMGIILEEDCVPSMAFFDFCLQLLPKYKNDYRVWYIGGNNLIEEYTPNTYDYYFTFFAYQWGWATWANRWKKIIRTGFDVEKIIEYKLYDQLYASKRGAKRAYKFLKKEKKENGLWKPMSWDYIFNMTMRMNGGFGIAPRINLVTNIGVFGTNSKGINKLTHNRKIPSNSNYPIQNHPPFIVPDFRYNQIFIKKILLKENIFINRLFVIVNKFLNFDKK